MSVYIINKPSAKELSQRELEANEKYCKIIQWGRGHPVEFGNLFCGFDHYDFQAYVLYNTWFSTFALWLVCRDGSKTYMIAEYTMLRSLLFPMHRTYLIANSGDQSREIFKKIEDISKRQIESARGLTDVFYNEVVKSGATSDGFIKDPASNRLKLYNSSEIFTLNSNIINIKGKRANLVVFDESAWMSEEQFVQAEHFTDQNSEAILGGGVDIRLEPKPFPRQLLYSSSASDTDSEFYKKFKDLSSKMAMGDRKYFVCNFTVDMIMAAKKGGEPYAPLISKEKLKQGMVNQEKGEREYYNKFTSEVHEGQIVTRRDFMKVTENRLPELSYSKGKKYIFAWDSARLNDNSDIGVASIYLDKKTGWNMNIENCINLVDINTKNKTPMRMPEQVEEFKKILLRYNGNETGAVDYENIEAVICDSGAGGQMVGGIADYLLADWYDESGEKHKGIIDADHKANETARMEFPDAVDIMKLVDPRKYRNDLFDAAEKMTKLGVVHFPAEYDGKDFLTFYSEDGNDETIQLSFEEQLALAQITLMKDETVLMCKYQSNGNVTYNYPPDKRNKVHDDRCFVYALLCWYLAKLRKNELRDNSTELETNVAELITARAPSYLRR